MSGRRKKGCSRGKGSGSRGLWDVSGDVLKATDIGFLSSFFEC